MEVYFLCIAIIAHEISEATNVTAAVITAVASAASAEPGGELLLFCFFFWN